MQSTKTISYNKFSCNIFNSSAYESTLSNIPFRYENHIVFNLNPTEHTLITITAS